MLTIRLHQIHAQSWKLAMSIMGRRTDTQRTKRSCAPSRMLLIQIPVSCNTFNKCCNNKLPCQILTFTLFLTPGGSIVHYSSRRAISYTTFLQGNLVHQIPPGQYRTPHSPRAVSYTAFSQGNIVHHIYVIS